MAVQKQRSDVFRHWIVGLGFVDWILHRLGIHGSEIGTGDLIVDTVGAQVHHFELPNVARIETKLNRILDMLREKQVVRPSASPTS